MKTMYVGYTTYVGNSATRQ